MHNLDLRSQNLRAKNQRLEKLIRFNATYADDAQMAICWLPRNDKSQLISEASRSSLFRKNCLNCCRQWENVMPGPGLYLAHSEVFLYHSTYDHDVAINYHFPILGSVNYRGETLSWYLYSSLYMFSNILLIFLLSRFLMAISLCCLSAPLLRPYNTENTVPLLLILMHDFQIQFFFFKRNERHTLGFLTLLLCGNITYAFKLKFCSWLLRYYRWILFLLQLS